MDGKLIRQYGVEAAGAAVAVVGALAAAIAGGGAASAALACIASAGVGAVVGSLLHRGLDGERAAELEGRLSELEGRPTAEAFGELKQRASASAERLASAEAALTSLAGECDAACRQRDALAAEAESLRVTASLDRFSDFQLLGMCDVSDAEDAQGYLARPLDDPAMEQLLARGAVTFDSASRGQAGQNGDLRWNLSPEWRLSVRMNRASLDERTRALRERRGASQGAAGGN